MSPNNSFKKLHFSGSIKGTSLCYCQEIPREKCQLQIAKLDNEKKKKCVHQNTNGDKRLAQKQATVKENA